LRVGKISQEEAELIHETLFEFGNGIFVELGVGRAETSYFIAMSLDTLNIKSVFIGVDSSIDAKIAWEKYFSKEVYDCCRPIFIFGNSFDLSINADWVFVDACHCFDCVSKDIRTWGPNVRDGGFFLFHDAHESVEGTVGRDRTSHDVYGVCRALESLGDEFYLVKELAPPSGTMRVYRRHVS